MFTKTITYETLHTFYDGKVVIRSIKMFSDSRGMVSEVFRLDSDITNDSKMCYISETQPYILRGPHQHVSQRDEFISWKNHMSYMFYDPETKKSNYYITDPTKIINVSVAPGIIHSYRNLENKLVQTLNFPSSLFMGENKKSAIDEIRWEQKFEHNPVIFIFGANGRLGKKLTKTFFDAMGFHEYDVVPCYEKIENTDQLQIFIDKLEILFKGRKVYFFNCAALTNVQDKDTSFDKWEWANAKLPSHLANHCHANGWKFIGFSTDYVYREDESNNYIKSKKLFERIVANCGNGCVTIIRVANLYSMDLDDTHNLIAKFKNNVKNQVAISLDPRLSVYPTCVEDLSIKIVQMFKDNLFIHDEIKYFNIIPKRYNLVVFFNTFFNEPCYNKLSNVTPWDGKFENDPNATILNIEGNEKNIQELIKR